MLWNGFLFIQWGPFLLRVDLFNPARVSSVRNDYVDFIQPQ